MRSFGGLDRFGSEVAGAFYLEVLLSEGVLVLLVARGFMSYTDTDAF